jgi:glycolate oxidase FAD binding subunit
MDAGVSSRTAGVSHSLEADFHNLVAPENVRSAGASDTVAGVQPRLVVEPGSEPELAKVLKLANEARLAVIPRGSGTKLDWGNPPSRADIVVSTARLDKILEHAWADMTVTVEAGCTVAKLQQTLAQHGQRLAVDVLWPERATVGGILSTNDSGALRLRFGPLRDLIIGATLALADGTVAHSGGKVVKNVAGYDLHKLATGAFGTLGTIARAIFRLHPLPHHSQSLTIPARDVGEVQRIVLRIQESKLAHSALQARFSSSAAPSVDILLEGTEAGVSAQQEDLLKIIAPLAANRSAAEVWNARCELYGSFDTNPDRCAVAKLSLLPSSIAATIESMSRTAETQKLDWTFVLQAMGVGSVGLIGTAPAMHSALRALRQYLKNEGGSLVVHRRPVGMEPLDAWGDADDAVSLMRAVKMRFDPNATLNPGRFVGGI